MPGDSNLLRYAWDGCTHCLPHIEGRTMIPRLASFLDFPQKRERHSGRDEQTSSFRIRSADVSEPTTSFINSSTRDASTTSINHHCYDLIDICSASSSPIALRQSYTDKLRVFRYRVCRCLRYQYMYMYSPHSTSWCKRRLWTATSSRVQRQLHVPHDAARARGRV